MEIWGSGTPKREFLHVDDLGDACVFVLEKWQPSVDEIQYLNVGTGIDLTIKELAKEVSIATNFSGKIIWDTSKPSGDSIRVMNVNLAKSLGYEQSVSLEEGIKETIDWYRNEKI